MNLSVKYLFVSSTEFNGTSLKQVKLTKLKYLTVTEACKKRFNKSQQLKFFTLISTGLCEMTLTTNIF